MGILLFFSIVFTSSQWNKSSGYHTEPVIIDLGRDMQEVTSSTQFKVHAIQDSCTKGAELIKSVVHASKISLPDSSNMCSRKTAIPSEDTTKKKRKSDKTPAIKKKKMLQITKEDFGGEKEVFNPPSSSDFLGGTPTWDSWHNKYPEAISMLDTPLNQTSSATDQAVTVSNLEKTTLSNIYRRMILSPVNMYNYPCNNQCATSSSSSSFLSYAPSQTPNSFTEPFPVPSPFNLPPSNAPFDKNDELSRDFDYVHGPTPDISDLAILDSSPSPWPRNAAEVTPLSPINTEDGMSQHKKSKKKSFKSPGKETQTTQQSPPVFRESVGFTPYSTPNGTYNSSETVSHDRGSKQILPPSTSKINQLQHSPSTCYTASKPRSMDPNEASCGNKIAVPTNEQANHHSPGKTQGLPDHQANQQYPGGIQDPPGHQANQYYPGGIQNPPGYQANQYYLGGIQGPSGHQANQQYLGGIQEPSGYQANQYYPGGIQGTLDQQAYQYYSESIQGPPGHQANQQYSGGIQGPSDHQANQQYLGGIQGPSGYQANQYYSGGIQGPPDQQTCTYYSESIHGPSDHQANQQYPGGIQGTLDQQAYQYSSEGIQGPFNGYPLSSTESYNRNIMMPPQISCESNHSTSSTNDQSAFNSPSTKYPASIAQSNMDSDLEMPRSSIQDLQQQLTTTTALGDQTSGVDSSFQETMNTNYHFNKPISTENIVTNFDAAITSSGQSENSPNSAKDLSLDDTSQVVDQTYEEKLIEEFEALMKQCELTYERDAVLYFGHNYKLYFNRKKNSCEDEDKEEEEDDEDNDDDKMQEEDNDDDS